MTSPPPTRRSAESGADRFSTWFSRVVQIGGLAIVGYETVFTKTDRPWLLLVAAAMMIGGVGLRLLIRGVVRLSEEERQ